VRPHDDIEIFHALINDPFRRLAGFHLDLKPEEHHAVLFLVVVIKTEFGQHGRQSFDESIEFAEGLHTVIVAQDGCELGGTKLVKLISALASSSRKKLPEQRALKKKAIVGRADGGV
jgi:hypothetical protein